MIWSLLFFLDFLWRLNLIPLKIHGCVFAFSVDFDCRISYMNLCIRKIMYQYVRKMHLFLWIFVRTCEAIPDVEWIWSISHRSVHVSSTWCWVMWCKFGSVLRIWILFFFPPLFFYISLQLSWIFILVSFLSGFCWSWISLVCASWFVFFGRSMYVCVVSG